MAVQEEVHELRDRLAEFRMLVEFMGHAVEFVELRGNLGLPEKLEQFLAAFDRNRHVSRSMKDFCRRKIFDVVQGFGSAIRGIVRSTRQQAGRAPSTP